jgi:hypothetical protein
MRRLATGLSAVVAAFAMVVGGGSVFLANSSSAHPSLAASHRVRVVTYGPNLLDNPGFAHGRRGWWTSENRSARARIVAPGLGGSGKALRLSARAGSVAHVADQRSKDVGGHRDQRFQARVHVRSNNPHGTVVLRVRQWQRGHLVGVDQVRVHLRQPQWRAITVRSRVQTAHARLQVCVVTPQRGAQRSVVVDRVMLRRVRVHFVTVGGTGPTPSQTSTTPVTDPTTPVADPTTPVPDPTTPVADPTTPVPDPTQTTQPPATGSTLYGASVYQDGLTWPQALSRSNAWYGGMHVVRVYYSGMPDNWPGRAGAANAPVSVSFKDAPSRVLSGQDDAFFTNWFATAPRDRQIWWTYWHEPEDDIEAGKFTAADYRAAWVHLKQLADEAGNPNLHSTLILMCWSLNPLSHRSFDDYFPGKGTIDVLGWDCYNRSAGKGTYTAPADVFGPLVAKSDAIGLPFAIGEFGSVLATNDANGAGRAQWLADSAKYFTSHNAVFVTYFDSVIGADYRLLDAASRSAWRQVVTG